MIRAILVLAHEMTAAAQPSDVSLERLERAAAEFHAHPEARFATSGWAYRDDTEKSLADAMADYAIEHLGIPEGRIVRSHKARDTVGDAVFFARLLPADHVTVVTSTFHCSRAEQVFRFVLPARTTLKVIGVGEPADATQKAHEVRSLVAFHETFQGIEPGDLAAIEARLFDRHPLYNGDIDAKALRRHD
ncbi:MAG: YdcF family protein [Silicimonas sp.]|nr:YdcF family protein [Silicimonas sp.]